MSQVERLSRGQDYIQNIARMLGDLQGTGTVVNELIQNADDAGARRMRFTVNTDGLEVWNDGVFDKCEDVASTECAWLGERNHRCDFHSFREIGSGDKRLRPGRSTGAFGIGFTAVYQITDRPELFSSGEHWAVDEMADRDGRILRTRVEDRFAGTKFWLPWATEPSEFRARLRQEPLTPDAIARFPAEIRRHVPRAMPFIKNLVSIELDLFGQRNEFTLNRTPGSLVLTSSDGPDQEWVLLSGDFESDASILKTDHRALIEGERSAQAEVAIPLNEQITAGTFYVTLPTEESTHLPLLINAEFYPASDRKRVRFDDAPEGEWNRAAVRAAARVLASRLSELPELIGDDRLVALLKSARDLQSNPAQTDANAAMDAFWKEIVSDLPNTAVVPTIAGDHRSPREARLWAEDAERAAAPLLRSIGVDLVAETVKDNWYQLRSVEVGIENLHLSHVVAALEDCGATRRWIDERPPPGLDAASLGALWQLLEVLLTVKDRSNQTSRDSLQRCAVGPGWDGAIWPLGDLFQLDRATQGLLREAAVDAVFLDAERFGSSVPRLTEQVEEATVVQSVDLLSRSFEQPTNVSEATRTRLLSWIHRNGRDLETSYRAKVAALPIFPTSDGARPLTGLALPGDFRDPLGLATIVDLSDVEEMRPFFEELGAQRLTLAVFCTDFLAPALANDDLVGVKRERAVRFLAIHLSELRSDTGLRDALRPLPLVPCVDGAWRRGAEVYLRDDLGVLVGDEAAIALLPIIDRDAHLDFYGWLGAAAEPRPSDIVARCRQLRGEHSQHGTIAEAIVQHVGQRYAADPDRTAIDFAALREIPWLPAEGDATRGLRPDQVHLRFRQSLFSTQARFIDIAPSIERTNAEFLRWLGLGEEPTPDQVVAHLLAFAAQGRPVAGDLWIYLNNHAHDPALDALMGEQCLLLQESTTYVRPEEVYWGPHPFGRWRHSLSASFSQHRQLLDRLGVLEGPIPEHAVEVLLDVASNHSGETGSLIDDDVTVVQACWRLLNDAIADGLASPGTFADLRRAEVVLDSRNRLRKPADVYFRDSLTLAERFDGPVVERLIDRPEGMWEALSRAGVQNLSDAVTTHIVEQTLLDPGGTLPARLAQRARLLVRVLSTEDPSSVGQVISLAAEQRLQRLGGLSIQQTVEVDGTVHTSEPFERGALYQRDEDRLLWVERDQTEPVWLEVARELTRALNVAAGSAASVASVFRGILSADSQEAAQRELDELGYPALDEGVEGVAEPNVSRGLGGVESSESAGGFGYTSSEQFGSSIEPAAETDRSDSESGNGQDSESGNGGGAGTTASTDTPSRRQAEPGESGSSSPGSRAGTGTVSLERQSRLRSYVAPRPVDGAAVDTESGDATDEVDRRAVEAVMEYERERGRIPTQMPHEHPGYDVRSESSDGAERYIEVKGTAVRWGEQGVSISSRQYQEGQQRRDRYWLYVVDMALSTPQVHPIQDPVSQIDQYFFDDGWRVVSEQAEIPRPALLPLQLPTSPTGVPRAVPFREDPEKVEEAPTSWLTCGTENVGEDWFAVRITGHSLGMGTRGGVAVIRPLDREPDEDDLLLVRLHDQLDPDTETPTAIRLWRPEVDLSGDLLAVRLWSTGSVAPLTVAHPERLLVLGEVVEQLDVIALEELGYL